MGCMSSNAGGGIRNKDAVVDITNFDMTKPAERTVKDFPFYSTRLAEIDWQSIVAAGMPWSDPNFKPIVSSIIDESMARDNRIKAWSTLAWKRPRDVYGEGNYCVYKNIGPNDILQGKCGDCYFLSTLSSFAETPSRIQRIFLNPEVNSAGLYAVSLYVNGEKRTVVVDDQFPYDTNTDRWAFCRSSRDDGMNEIWPLILEKAWAKMFGSYQRIEAGTAGEAMYPMSGRPHRFFIHANLRNREKLWDRILWAENRNYPMCTAVASQTDDNLSRKTVKTSGLIDAHAYSLIAAKVIKLENGQQERLIQIRNPWGKKEWQGDWSDKSPKWTASTKQQVNLQDKNDGCFWISFKDYIKFFYITTICYYNEQIEDNYVPDQHELFSYGMSKFTLDEDHPESMVIAVDQINSRFVDETMLGHYEYPAIKLMLTKVKTETNPETQEQVIKQRYIHGCRDADTHVSLPLEKGLKRGTYILMYQAEFTEEYLERKLVVSVYCNKKVQLERVAVDEYDQDNYNQLDWALYEAVNAEEEAREDLD